MRTTLYLVSYDIREARRLRRVYRVMRGYGDHVQLSVFLCELSAQQLVELRGKLEAEIAAREDQVLIIPLGSRRQAVLDKVLAVGKPLSLPKLGARIF